MPEAEYHPAGAEAQALEEVLALARWHVDRLPPGRMRWTLARLGRSAALWLDRPQTFAERRAGR